MSNSLVHWSMAPLKSCPLWNQRGEINENGLITMRGHFGHLSTLTLGRISAASVTARTSRNVTSDRLNLFMVTMRDVYTLVSCTFTLCRTSDQTDLQTPSALTVWATVSWNCYHDRSITGCRPRLRTTGRWLNVGSLYRLLRSTVHRRLQGSKFHRIYKFVYLLSFSSQTHRDSTHSPDEVRFFLPGWFGGSSSYMFLLCLLHGFRLDGLRPWFRGRVAGCYCVWPAWGTTSDVRSAEDLAANVGSVVQPWTWGKPAKC